MQLAGSVAVILNRRIDNPHMRIEFVSFLLQIMPQKKVDKSHEKQNRLYKDVFYNNSALRKYLMHALVVTYVDSEKTDYYGKFQQRFASAALLEYIWSDEQYRAKFIEISEFHKDDFSEFCNILIMDMNSLLFDGLLALEEIKNFEELKEDDYTWSQLDQEQKEAAESNYNDKTRTAKFSFQLSNMVICLMSKVTLYVKDPFVSDELGENFA
jgi:hypothetical protein